MGLYRVGLDQRRYPFMEWLYRTLTDAASNRYFRGRVTVFYDWGRPSRGGKKFESNLPMLRQYFRGATGIRIGRCLEIALHVPDCRTALHCYGYGRRSSRDHRKTAPEAQYLRMNTIAEVFDARNAPTRKTPNQALEATRLRRAPQLERWPSRHWPVCQPPASLWFPRQGTVRGGKYAARGMEQSSRQGRRDGGRAGGA